MTLAQLVDEYMWSNERLKAMEELEWFRDAPSLLAAIVQAALGRKPNGALFSHQRHLEEDTGETAREVLVHNAEGIAAAPDFDALFKLIERVLEHVRGVGEMYIYDVSFRISAYLNRLPTRVYLHKGARVGAEALGCGRGRAYVEVEEFDPAVRKLKPHEIEDFLCNRADELRKFALRRHRS